MKIALLLLALSIAPRAMAEDLYHPNPKQLELTFGIEEELRSNLAKKAFLGIHTAIPLAVHTLVPTHSDAVKPFLDMSTIFFAPLSVGTLDTIHDRKQEKFIENILKECKKNGKFICSRDKIKILFQNRQTGEAIGHLKIARDPMVIEVTANPFKLKELDGDMGEILEKSLYGISKKTGLHAAQVGGQSHIHVDFASLFGGKDGNPIDFRFFRNYVVDWANHNELYYGALHYDPKEMGANPLLDDALKRKNFNSWLKKYDSILETGMMDQETFNNLRSELAIQCGFMKGDAINVLPRTTTFGNPINNFADAKLGTIEIRCSRPSKKMSELTRKLTIFEARANFIKNSKGLLPYYNSGAIQNAQEGVNRFALYLSESGLDWNEYKQVLPKTWQKKTPQVLPVDELFASGKLKPSMCFRAFTRTMIHIFGK